MCVAANSSHCIARKTENTQTKDWAPTPAIPQPSCPTPRAQLRRLNGLPQLRCREPGPRVLWAEPGKCLSRDFPPPDPGLRGRSTSRDMSPPERSSLSPLALENSGSEPTPHAVTFPTLNGHHPFRNHRILIRLGQVPRPSLFCSTGPFAHQAPCHLLFMIPHEAVRWPYDLA